jgi:hypothetical protein
MDLDGGRGLEIWTLSNDTRTECAVQLLVDDDGGGGTDCPLELSPLRLDASSIIRLIK